MAEQFLTLGHKDRTEILEVAALKTGRPAHLLEKDIQPVNGGVKAHINGGFAKYLIIAVKVFFRVGESMRTVHYFSI